MKMMPPLFWLWTRLMVTMVVLLCYLAFFLFQLLALTHTNAVMYALDPTLEWLATGSLILAWIGTVFLFPWVTKKWDQNRT